MFFWHNKFTEREILTKSLSVFDCVTKNITRRLSYLQRLVIQYI